MLFFRRPISFPHYCIPTPPLKKKSKLFFLMNFFVLVLLSANAENSICLVWGIFSLKPRRMFAKRWNSWNFQIIFFFLWEILKEILSKIPHSCENPMKITSLQPSNTVAKGKYILCYCNLWLQRRNIYKFICWLLKTIIYLWSWQEKANFNSEILRILNLF